MPSEILWDRIIGNEVRLGLEGSFDCVKNKKIKLIWNVSHGRLKILLLLAIYSEIQPQSFFTLPFITYFFLLSFQRWAFNDQLSGEKFLCWLWKVNSKITIASLNTKNTPWKIAKCFSKENQKFTQIVPKSMFILEIFDNGILLTESIFRFFIGVFAFTYLVVART